MKNIFLLFFILWVMIGCGEDQNIQKEEGPTAKENETVKELYIPETVWKVPEANNYDNNKSTFSFDRMAESDNIAIFWSKEFGMDPSANSDPRKRFFIDKLLMEGERFYEFYVNQLKFVEKGNSVTDQYKILIYIIGGEGGTAFGGGADNKIGILWAPPSRVNKEPFGALAHELGHAFQYLLHADGFWAFTSASQGSRGQTIFEMTSQFMLWHVYPDWLNFENYHLDGFMEKTHLAFLHEKNQYHSPFILEYWADKHGIGFIGRLWREAEKGEDPVMAYKRITSIDQEEFNDEMFDAARKFVTWDIERIEDIAQPYANQHFTSLVPIGSGWYQISKDKAPQNYGYNAIKLNVPAAGTEVTIHFKGIAGAEGFRSIKIEHAGWRYGFLAVKEDGTRVYGDIFSDPKGLATFKIPKQTRFLWFIVSGAPTEHWVHLADGEEENDEQWPYNIKISGTSINGSMIE